MSGRREARSVGGADSRPGRDGSPLSLMLSMPVVLAVRRQATAQRLLQHVRPVIDGAGVGVTVAAGVAAWVGGRLALAGSATTDVELLRDAAHWAGKLSARVGASPLLVLASLLAGYVAAAAILGGAIALVVRRTRSRGRAQLMTLTGMLVVEYGLWRVAERYADPWLKAVVWYHLVAASLTAVVLLESGHAARSPRVLRRPAGRFRPTLERPITREPTTPRPPGDGAARGRGLAPPFQAAHDDVRRGEDEERRHD